MALPLPPRDEVLMLFLCTCFLILLIISILTYLGHVMTIALSLTDLIYTCVEALERRHCQSNNCCCQTDNIVFRSPNTELNSLRSDPQLHRNTRQERTNCARHLQEMNARIGQQTAADLLHENEVMRHLIECTICKTRRRRVVFIPCGHLLTCEVCGQDTTICPACGLGVNSSVVVNK